MKAYFAVIGFLIGMIVGLLILGPSRQKILALPIKYDTCSNIPGVEGTCRTWARFSDKESCELYKSRVWGDKEPPKIMLAYCVE